MRGEQCSCAMWCGDALVACLEVSGTHHTVASVCVYVRVCVCVLVCMCVMVAHTHPNAYGCTGACKYQAPTNGYACTHWRVAVSQESVVVNKQLADLVEKNHAPLLGLNNVNLPRIMSIFAEVRGCVSARRTCALRCA